MTWRNKGGFPVAALTVLVGLVLTTIYLAYNRVGGVFSVPSPSKSAQNVDEVLQPAGAALTPSKDDASSSATLIPGDPVTLGSRGLFRFVARGRHIFEHKIFDPENDYEDGEEPRASVELAVPSQLLEEVGSFRGNDGLAVFAATSNAPAVGVAATGVCVGLYCENDLALEYVLPPWILAGVPNPPWPHIVAATAIGYQGFLLTDGAIDGAPYELPSSDGMPICSSVEGIARVAGLDEQFDGASRDRGEGHMPIWDEAAVTDLFGSVSGQISAIRTVDGNAWTVVGYHEPFGGIARILHSATGTGTVLIQFAETPPYVSDFIRLRDDGGLFAARIRFADSTLADPRIGVGVLWQWVVYRRDRDGLVPVVAIDEARCWELHRVDVERGVPLFERVYRTVVPIAGGEEPGFRVGPQRGSVPEGLGALTPPAVGIVGVP